MDAYSSGPINVTYSDEAPVLLAASSDAAMSRAEPAIRAASLRLGAKLTLGAARDRLKQQGRAAAVWLEIDQECGDELDGLLDRLRGDVSSGRYGAVVSVTGPRETLPRLIDPVSSLIDDDGIELIANPDVVDRIAALATATAKLRLNQGVADAAADRNAERLRQLSEEVSRIASALARISAEPGMPRTSPNQIATGELAALSADTVGNVIRARRLRSRFFPEELFADPAWDMLLDLLQAEIRQHRVPVSSLCIAAAVPATTALRWLKTLVSQGLFVRRADPHDGRRVFVELAPDTSLAMRRYFAEAGSIVAI